MQKKIFAMIAAVLGLAVAAYYFHSTSRTRAMNSGNVIVNEQASDTSAPLPDTAAAPTAAPTPAATGTGAPASTPDSKSASPAPATTESVPLNRIPPNGMAYKGTGKFLIYRQGDLTWRLDSSTGNACVIFATNAQWSKPLVYDHGCGTS
jgi:hypothetical protein